jgi:hypothetical protein
MKKKFIIGSTILILVGLVGLVLLLGPRLGIGIRSFVDFESGRLSSCEKNMNLFSEAPVQMDKLTRIGPLGSLDPAGGHVFPVDHTYLFTTAQTGSVDAGKSGEVDVWSPGSAHLTRVAYIEYSEGNTVVDKDYSIYFQPCREVEAAFYHIKSLSPELISQLGDKLKLQHEGTTGQHTQRRFEAKTNIELRAGDFIGKAGGTFRSQAFDFRLVDKRTDALAYANPSRWGKPQQHIVCPFDYFTEPLKGQFMSLMGSAVGQRSTSPVCGRIDQDIKGTVQGAWFTEMTKETYPEDPHLALAHDDIKPSKPIFSIGTSMGKSGLKAGLYSFDVKKTGMLNRDFNAVTEVGKIYCYQGLKGKWGDSIAKVVMVELVDDKTMRMEARSGLSCVGIDWAFSDRMTVFER